MPNSLMMIFSGPTSPESEDEYNQWYTEKHIVDVANIPGVKSATRYKLDKTVAPMEGIPPDPRGYLAIYELEAENSEELEEITRQLHAAIAAGTVDVSPTLDVTNLSASFAMPISAMVTKAGSS